MVKLKVGSRESALAVAQTKIAIAAIQEIKPELEIELVTMKTTGDMILDRPLNAIGGKGLFVKELDKALLDGRIDIAVHSLKDLPMEENPALPLLAFLPREEPRDALVLPAGSPLEDLPPKPDIVFGCSSLRRQLQLSRIYPNCQFVNCRGNVLTRLKKLDNGDFDALVLAAAGLNRLGLTERISRLFTEREILPAAGQGIIAVQGRKDMAYDFITALDDDMARDRGMAERSFVRALNGDCSLPVASYALINGEQIWLSGLWVAPGEERVRFATLGGKRSEAVNIGIKLAKKLQSL